jgi:hypothetical protein
VVGKVAMGQVFLRELPFFIVNIIPPVLFISSSSTYCYYQKNKRVKPENFPKRDNLLKIRKHCIEKYIYVAFKRLQMGNEVYKTPR